MPSVRLAGAIDTLVPPQIGVHALAVVREAVSNAVRHAGAERVIVTVEADDDLLIDIVDDGIGIDPTVARSGLRNLDERAQECGGELVVRTRAARWHAAELAGALGVSPQRTVCFSSVA